MVTESWQKVNILLTLSDYKDSGQEGRNSISSTSSILLSTHNKSVSTITLKCTPSRPAAHHNNVLTQNLLLQAGCQPPSLHPTTSSRPIDQFHPFLVSATYRYLQLPLTSIKSSDSHSFHAAELSAWNSLSLDRNELKMVLLCITQHTDFIILMGLQLTTVSKFDFSALCVINSSPLKPVKYNKKAKKVNEAVGGNQHSMEIWKVGRWFYQQRQTRQNNHADH